MDSRQVSLTMDFTVQKLEQSIRHDNAAQVELLWRMSKMHCLYTLAEHIKREHVRRGDFDKAIIAEWLMELAKHIEKD
jgi:hypothetical protein